MIKSQLAPEDREDLRKAAIEKLLSMDGMTKDWLNECAIESVENQILRERMVWKDNSVTGGETTCRIIKPLRQYVRVAGIFWMNHLT